MLDVVVLLLGGNYASTAIGPVEVFHSAGSLWNVLIGGKAEPRFRVITASMDGGSVMSAYPVALSPQAAIDDIERADVVIVPSSGLDFDKELACHLRLMPWLRRMHQQGAYIAAVCTGVLFLAEAGLLDGRQATTHWAVGDELAKRYPKVNWQTDMFVTEDERILCSGGVYAAIDLSLYMVEKLCGHEIAVDCAKSLVVGMPRSHQSGYAILPLARPHADERIRKAERYIDQNYSQDLSIETLAEQANMSPRNFLRRFKAATGRLPGNYLQTLRIAVAKRMLEEDKSSVQAISLAVGYEDLAYFRTLFRRYTGMTPGDYRNQFGRTLQAAFTRSSGQLPRRGVA